MARIQGSGHRSAQMDVAHAEYQILRVEHDLVHPRHVVEPVDPADELDVVRAPRGVRRTPFM